MMTGSRTLEKITTLRIAMQETSWLAYYQPRMQKQQQEQQHHVDQDDYHSKTRVSESEAPTLFSVNTSHYSTPGKEFQGHDLTTS